MPQLELVRAKAQMVKYGGILQFYPYQYSI